MLIQSDAVQIGCLWPQWTSPRTQCLLQSLQELWPCILGEQMGCTLIKLWGTMLLCSCCISTGLRVPPTERIPQTGTLRVYSCPAELENVETGECPHPLGLCLICHRDWEVLCVGVVLKPHKCQIIGEVVIRAGSSLHCPGLLCPLRSWVKDKESFEQDELPQQGGEESKKNNRGF